jgi:signal peptidase I
MESLPHDEQDNPTPGTAAVTELAEPTEPEEASTQPDLEFSVASLLRDVSVAVVVAILIIFFLYRPVVVEGTSMLPRLLDRDRLVINEFVYHFTAIERGDVVVFHYPRNPEESYIKRVIALPGDRLRIVQGTVWVNGKPVDEPYVPDAYKDYRSRPEEVIPAGYYFMMGDHRSVSSDSREFGPVERSLIYGKAVFVYWPARDAGVVR